MTKKSKGLWMTYWGLLLGWLGGGCPVSICQHINDRDLAGNGAPFVWGRDYAFDRACSAP